MTEVELQKAEKDLKKWQMEWKKKKRGCMECASTMSEMMDMNRKTFIEKCGIETDEEMNVVCPI